MSRGAHMQGEVPPLWFILGDIFSDNMPDNSVICLKAGVHPSVKFVTFKRRLRLTGYCFGAYGVLCSSNLSSAFWCHLQ